MRVRGHWFFGAEAIVHTPTARLHVVERTDGLQRWGAANQNPIARPVSGGFSDQSIEHVPVCRVAFTLHIF